MEKEKENRATICNHFQFVIIKKNLGGSIGWYGSDKTLTSRLAGPSRELEDPLEKSR